ncbi:MAG TPA: cytochrome ubiquinol oxidase subunit I, partial [Acetobacteraceae bacterium]
VRHRFYEARWFQFVTMATTPLGFVAVLAGWTTTEAGRQPWVVYGQLRTVDAVAPVTAYAVTTSLLVFFVAYNVLLLAFLWFAARIALRGPGGAGVTHAWGRSGLDRSAPIVVGAEPTGPAPVADVLPARGA